MTDRTIDKIAWILLDGGRILSTRSRGKDVYYLPGGKREPGESDVRTLVREVKEELTVDVLPETAAHLGTWEAQAHGHAGGVTVRMTCYTADHTGTPAPSSEIEEIAWLGYADRGRVSPVDQLIFDDLHAAGRLR
ncbi:NUDIX domain-containing protein [Actinomadura nitritigenes]|uniref:NUDIX domain-containing protein n=1 Tax=Actinomadura nitritigenes TaxID=134602 RepID=A0ABS3QZQ1_9ACTN|nr:NUDIX domain-containing protein [Actinomadura nitritigenes]MBO2439426.1 NUDIX domain-containing protein [Actinomadura nitritigenes]